MCLYDVDVVYDVSDMMMCLKNVPFMIGFMIRIPSAIVTHC